MSQHSQHPNTAGDPKTAGNPIAARKRWLRWGALGAVVLVPLAFVGLFVGALSQSDTSIDRIPAAIVNEDSLVTTTAPDGTEQNVFAGRQLVTELTGSGSQGFDWTITNAADAKDALARGEVYAILTVPEDFSTSVLSIQGDEPVKSNLTIQTDDAHSYLTGSVLQVVGQTMVGTFGKQITEQYISGLSAGLGGLGTALTTAADGATQLGTGATGLADGATQLGGGAAQLGSGLTAYTSGVSSLSAGLAKLDSGAAGLTAATGQLGAYTGGVSQLSAALNQYVAQSPGLSALDGGALATIAGELSKAAAGGDQLGAGLSSGIAGVQSGISQSAAGAAKLAAGGGALVTGANGLATGASAIADGATQLATGAGTLAAGLADGAAQVPSGDADAAAATAEVAAEPVTLSVTTDNAVTDIGQVVATFLVPFGLWIGALAVFLVLRPFTRRVLASTAVDGRLVFSALGRAGVVTGAQALLLVLLLHVSIGVGWALLPATLLFSLLMAAAFTAFHYLLTSAFGRAGLVVSLFLLAVQITATGGIYPIQVLSEPFQAISPFLPLTYGVSGMQGILAGGSTAPVLTAVAALAGFGVLSVVLALAAVRRSRSARLLGLAPLTP